MSDKLKSAESRVDDICRWGNTGLRDRVIEVVRTAMRDQRHFCAEVIAAHDNKLGLIGKDVAHQLIMNASVDVDT